MTPENCPACEVSFQGEPIPEGSQELFGATHFSRCIGIVHNDRVTHWRCPDCGHVWERE